MAFRLRVDETVVHGLRRVARKELKSAAKQLRKSTPPSDEAIHEARKSVKKTRAVLALVKEDDGRGLDGSEKRLQRVSHELSTLRDADAMLKILDALKRSNGRAFTGVFTPIRERLASKKRKVTRRATADRAWRRMSKSLQTLGKKARRWRPSHDGFDALVAGLTRAHKDGRAAMARAKTRGRADDFHDWRKAMKMLWYELRLIERAGDGVRRDIMALHHAEAALGDEHNVAVLCEEIGGDPEIRRDAVAFDRIRLAADRFRRRLRDRAFDEAARIYETPTRTFVRRLKTTPQAPRKKNPASVA